MSSSNAPAAAVDKKMFVLTSSDGERFEVEEEVAVQLQTVKIMIEDCPDSSVYPLHNVNGPILAKVIEYCKNHVKGANAEKVKEFDEKFLDEKDQATMFDLIMASNYLEAKGLLDFTCRTAANMIKGKTPEQIRRAFNIENDFTPEEEEEIRKENQWAFE